MTNSSQAGSRRTKTGALDAHQTDHSTETSGRPDALTLAGFAALVVLVAANVVAIRFTNRELPPFLGAGLRFAASSLLFFAIVIFRRAPLPRGRAIFGVLIYGALQFGIGFALLYWALLQVPASMASVILASVPIFTLLFAFAVGLEPLRLRGFLGALVALGGIAVMFGVRTDGGISFIHLLATVATAACFSLAPIVAKLFSQIRPASMNAVGMLTGTLILFGLSWAFGETATLPHLPETWIATIYLVLPGSMGVFGLLLFLLRRWTASGVSYQSVLSPVIAILLSAWLLGEPLSGGLFLGAALVSIGVYVGALAPGRAFTRRR